MESNQSSNPGNTRQLNFFSRARVLFSGVFIPFGIVILVWFATSTWTDLPIEFPSHWSGTEADGFTSPQSFISSQSVAGLVAAAVTASLGIGHQWGGNWSSLGRCLTSIGVGITAAIAFGLFVQMHRARGLFTAEVVELGAASGILGVIIGFIAFGVGAYFLMPTGKSSVVQS